MKTVLLFLYFTFHAFAGPREFEERKSTCNQQLVNQCIGQNAEAAQRFRHWAQEKDHLIHSASVKVLRTREMLGESRARLATIDGEITDAERELKQLRPLSRPVQPVFADLSLAEHFRLPEFRLGWQERYPKDRVAMLERTLERARERKTKAKSRVDASEAEYDRSNSEYQSIVARKNKDLESAAGHEAMCNGGCRNEICPTR